MLKISSKQEKIRDFLFKQDYYFFIHKIIKLFLVKTYDISKVIYWGNIYNMYFSFFSFTKTRSICLLTGRSRSVYRSFKMSRLKIRTYSRTGYFIGLSKASW